MFSAEQDGKNKMHHSHFYHEFFRGYTEAYVPKKNGKGQRLVRVYSEDYVVPDVSTGNEIFTRILYFMLLGCAAASFLYGCAADAAYNRSWYVALPVMLTLLFFALIFLTLVFYLFRPEKLTEYEYRSTSGKLLAYTRLGAAFAGITFAFALLQLLLSGGAGDWLHLWFFLLAAGLLLLLFGAEQKKPYRIEKNTNAKPEDGNEIW